ncbi:unnamed protein product [Macrosiphum euphorbiae]|nr:unnamed protein product [Macrosiphum euphorbiae]
MAEKGETNINISSTDENSDDIMRKKKNNPKLLLDCSDPSSSCPRYSASDDDSDNGVKLITNSKSHRSKRLWSPSPSKKKFKCQSDPQGSVKYFDVNIKKSAVRKISYSDSDRNENIASEITTESLVKNIENSSIQSMDIELVELDRLLNNGDDIIEYSNDYITIDANDSSVLAQNKTAAAAVTSVTPSDKQSSAVKHLIMTNEKRALDINTSSINPG